MAKRALLHIDILRHLNEITFAVYRTRVDDPTFEQKHVMDVTQNLTIKKRQWQTNEKLVQNKETPYLFNVRRHYELDGTPPNVRVETDPVNISDLFHLADERQIEIFSSKLGAYDARSVYMDYEYETIPLFDDIKIENGKKFYGPAATALNMVETPTIQQITTRTHLKLNFSYRYDPVEYQYYIQALDSTGNASKRSELENIILQEDDVYFRIQRSKDNNIWEDVAVTQLKEWYIPLLTIEKPDNLQNTKVIPLSSKRTSITFNNPWFLYNTYIRRSYYHRVRAEDDNNGHTDWVYIDSIDVVLKPKKIRIRRKLDNKRVSSYDGIDAFTVFELDASRIDETVINISLIDDQLTDDNRYSYTFFYEDEFGNMAEPFYLVSNNKPWENIIIPAGHTKIRAHDIAYKNFEVSFELADRLIEIGEDA